MNCREIRRQLSEALDGAQVPAAARRHLDSCLSCAAAFARMGALGAAFAALPARAPSAGFDAAVLAALASRPAVSFSYKAAVAAGAVSGAAVLVAAARAASALLSGGAWAGVAAAFARLAAFAAKAGALAVELRPFLPEPRFGVELAAASLLAIAVVATISLPSISPVRALGARS